MSEKILSIIIIVYNEERYIHLILDSLAKQTFKGFEVIVVDSNSTDETETVAKRFAKYFSEFRYHRLDCTRGPAYGRNRGVELSKYNRLLFLDADTKYPKNFIANSLKEINRNKIDVATCPISIAENNILSNLGTQFLNMFMIILKPIYPSAYGACLFSTKEVHSRIGGFDENIGVCEDCNYVKKAIRKYNYKFRILRPHFYTSDRRVKVEGNLGFMLKYIKIHLYRMISGKEIINGTIEYNYGEF